MVGAWVGRHTLEVAALVLSFLFVLGGMGWAYAALRDIEQPLIVHFTAAEGITEVGTIRTILLGGVFGLTMCAVNTAITLSLLARERFLGYLLAVATLLVSILLFIRFAAIISVN
jgi:hypothetical protein